MCNDMWRENVLSRDPFVDWSSDSGADTADMSLERDCLTKAFHAILVTVGCFGDYY